MSQAGSVFAAAAPAVSDAEAISLLHTNYGLAQPRLSPLPSERDQNLRVDDGDRHLVLKISNAREDPAVADLEIAAMAHVARVDPDLPIPRVVPTTDGAPRAAVRSAGHTLIARLITVVPGRRAEGLPIGVRLAEAIGTTCARTQIAMQGFFHPAAGGRELDWDIRRLPRLVAVPDHLARALEATVALPSWVLHGDVTLTNLLTDAGGEQITGVIDFGDMHHTAAVCDLAVTLTSLLRNTSAEQPAGLWQLAGAVLRGYQRLRPLTPAEVDVLGDLVLARLLTTLAVSARRAPVHRDNTDYITQYDSRTQQVLDTFGALSPDGVRDRFRRLAGLSAPGLTGAGVAGLLDRRRTVAGGALSPLFYREPLDIVRGEGVWLIDRDGRRYLDGYNNVAVVGHAHPAVVQAVTRQAALLHTHSRYLHPNMVQLAERLVASMPVGLDTCLFTTSGTEANELAWRLATEFTGGTGAIIGSHAYHGSSKQMADLSSNEWPRRYRPPSVATFDGPVQAPSSLTRAEARARIARAAAELEATGARAAMVMADSMFTSDGVRPVGGQFLTGLVDGAHAAGALYVADEVQIGFGRTGPQLWRFAALAVVPDVVTLGKPMGAGYPIGAVITRREIADALAARYEYFSTFAANPVAAAAGLAVLDVLQDEGIGARAVEVGAYLRERVTQLRSSHPVLGEARGDGLIAGIDLPSRELARAAVEGLKARAVLVGSTGRDGNVLKVRPPLVWEHAHVEMFVQALDGALTDLDHG